MRITGGIVEAGYYTLTNQEEKTNSTTEKWTKK